MVIISVPPSGKCIAHSFRLKPGDKVMSSLKDYAAVILSRQNPEFCSSAFIMTTVGSVSDITLRLANASKTDPVTSKSSSENDIRRWPDQRFEVVSLVGTFSRNQGCHVHISLSDAKGDTIGGHLIEGTVFTTLEVVMGTIDCVEFKREMDDQTGYKELVPNKLHNTLAWRKKKFLFFTMIAFTATVGVFRSKRAKD